jgi:hypothetical protein
MNGSSFGPEAHQTARNGIGCCGFSLPPSPTNWLVTQLEHSLLLSSATR